VLFFVQSLRSLPFEDQLGDIFERDFSTFEKKENHKELHFSLFEDNEYVTVRFYEYVVAVVGSTTVNVSAFAESWVIGDGNQTRIQYVEYFDGNDTGNPFEVVIEDSTNGYVMQRSSSGVSCTTAKFSSAPSLIYTYVDTRFITPSFSEFDLIWGPRLIDLYYTNYDAHTIFVVGLDAFTYDLVLFYDHVTKTTSDLQEIVLVHSIDYEEFDLSNVEVPSTVTCTASDVDPKENHLAFNTYFPMGLF
jgi:hypothetical protein